MPAPLTVACALAAACATDRGRRDLLVWDDERACFEVEHDAIDLGKFAVGTCPEAETRALRADGSCVILPVTCLPRGFAPAGAADDRCVDAALEPRVLCDEP